MTTTRENVHKSFETLENCQETCLVSGEHLVDNLTLHFLVTCLLMS